MMLFNNFKLHDTSVTCLIEKNKEHLHPQDLQYNQSKARECYFLIQHQSFHDGAVGKRRWF